MAEPQGNSPKDIRGKKLIDLCESYMEPKELPSELNKTVKEVSHLDNMEFVNVINALLTNLGKMESQGGEYLILNTGDLQDLLLCGTEVSGSCQRVDRSPSLNKGLLGYLLDGKHRMIAVKDPDTGKIAARTIIRLLWDNTSKKNSLISIAYLSRALS